MALWCCMFSLWSCIKKLWGVQMGSVLKLESLNWFSSLDSRCWNMFGKWFKIHWKLVWLFQRTHDTMQNLFKYYIYLFVCLQILHIYVCIHGRAVLWKSIERWGSGFSTFIRCGLGTKLRFSDLVPSACIFWDTCLSAIQTLNVTP